MPTTKCPRCGSTSVVPILYGMPSHEAREAAERGELVIGGCEVEIGQPSHACRACGHRWEHRTVHAGADG